MSASNIEIIYLLCEHGSFWNRKTSWWVASYGRIKHPKKDRWLWQLCTAEAVRARDLDGMVFSELEANDTGGYCLPTLCWSEYGLGESEFFDETLLSLIHHYLGNE